MKRTATALLFLALLAGCARHSSQPSASPMLVGPTTDGRTACESSGGHWNALTHFCELQY